jgi:hypothetical protein
MMKLLTRCCVVIALAVLGVAASGCGGYGSTSVYVGVGAPGPYVGYPYYGPHRGWVGRPYPSPYWRDRDDPAPEQHDNAPVRADSTDRTESRGG